MKKILLAAITVAMTACSSSVGPIKIRDNQAVTTAEVTQMALVQPVLTEEKERPQSLVDKLSRQANAALDNNQYEQAINTAERGLRVDRREPRFYLILAAAYQLLSNVEQAKHFAQQGLRYVDAADDMYQQLSRYLK